MRMAGLSAHEILTSATVAIGQYFNEEDEFGVIASGMRADLVLLDGNPIESLENLKSPAGVMVRGKWLPRTEIEKRLDAIADRSGS